ncbi:hypothetical protein OC835_001465 [Tilletia horrida]|nr:hypothetical protein OC835_001465 [Tilletia horrida]
MADAAFPPLPGRSLAQRAADLRAAALEASNRVLALHSTEQTALSKKAFAEGRATTHRSCAERAFARIDDLTQKLNEQVAVRDHHAAVAHRAQASAQFAQSVNQPQQAAQHSATASQHRAAAEQAAHQASIHQFGIDRARVEYMEAAQQADKAAQEGADAAQEAAQAAQQARLATQMADSLQADARAAEEAQRAAPGQTPLPGTALPSTASRKRVPPRHDSLHSASHKHHKPSKTISPARHGQHDDDEDEGDEDNSGDEDDDDDDSDSDSDSHSDEDREESGDEDDNRDHRETDSGGVHQDYLGTNASSTANRSTAASALPKRMPRKGTKWTPEAKQACHQLEAEFGRRQAELAQQFGLSVSDVKIRIGYSTEVGRELGWDVRYSRWRARHKDSAEIALPAGFLPRNATVKAELALIKLDDTQFNSIKARIEEDEAQDRLNQDEPTARRVFQRVKRRARKLAHLASQNEGVAIVSFVASSNVMVPSVCIGVPHAIKVMRQSYAASSTFAQLRRHFEVNMSQQPLPYATPLTDTANLVLEDVIPHAGTIANPKGDPMPAIKKGLPTQLNALILAAYRAHKDTVDRTGYNRKSRKGASLPWRNLFTILQTAGLCVDGFPADSDSMILKGTYRKITAGDESPAAVGSLRVSSGSMQHYGYWSQPAAKELWAALIRREVHVILSPETRPARSDPSASIGQTQTPSP